MNWKILVSFWKKSVSAGTENYSTLREMDGLSHHTVRKFFHFYQNFNEDVDSVAKFSSAFFWPFTVYLMACVISNVMLEYTITLKMAHTKYSFKGVGLH
jgi:hypothetical protein